MNDSRNFWKNNSFPIGFAAIFIVALFAAVIAYIKYYPVADYQSPAPSIGQSGGKNTAEKSEKSTGTDLLHYYYQTYDDPRAFSVYALNSDIVLKDKPVATIKGQYSFLGRSNEEGKYLVCESSVWPCGNKLFLLDINSGQINNYFSVDQGGFSGAVFSRDGESLAYSLYFERSRGGAKGEVWIRDIKSGVNRKIFEKEPLDLYAALRVLGWSVLDNKIIASEIGGDGPGVWGKIYLGDAAKTSDNFQKIEAGEQDMESFLMGKPSPDGKNWLYKSCEQSVQVEDEEPACETGEEIKIYNFSSKEAIVVYKNQTHFDNVFGGKLRVVFSAVWQDNQHVVFSIPDGIYRVDIESRKIEELYKFNWSATEHITKFASYIIYADKNTVVFSKYNLYGGNYFLDLATKKVIALEGSMFKIDGVFK